MSTKVEKIKQLLGQGLSHTIVAEAVGVDISIVSKLLDDTEFRAEVAAIRVVKAGAAVQRDDKINQIEDKVLAALESSIDNRAPFMKTTELLTAFRIVNLARRRGVQTTDSMAEGVVVNLTIPKQHLEKFTMTITPEGEVIGVQEQTLVTMSSQQVLNMLPEKDRKQAARRLPSMHRASRIDHGIVKLG